MIIISLKISVKITTIYDQINNIIKIKQRHEPSLSNIIFVSEKCLAILMGYYGKP